MLVAEEPKISIAYQRKGLDLLEITKKAGIIAIFCDM